MAWILSEDGAVLLHDTRDLTPRRRVGAFQLNAEVTSVQYHPHMDHIFVMSDARGNCNLWDTRMVFGHQDETPKSILTVASVPSFTINNTHWHILYP